MGVIITDTLSFDEHVNTVVTRVSQVGYALSILRADGLRGQALWDVARSTAISRLTYASPAWYGYLNKNSLSKIQGVINRFKRYGYLPADQEDFSVICEIADNRLFNTVLNNRNHVLHQLLPPVKLAPYDLRTRSHNHSLPHADNSLRENFIYRLLYKNIYWNNIPLLVARILCYYLCFVHVRQSYVNKLSTIQYNELSHSRMTPTIKLSNNGSFLSKCRRTHRCLSIIKPRPVVQIIEAAAG